MTRKYDKLNYGVKKIDDRDIQKQVNEIRAVVRSVLNYLEEAYAFNWSSIPVCVNDNPMNGSVGDFIKKYNNRGELK